MINVEPLLVSAASANWYLPPKFRDLLAHEWTANALEMALSLYAERSADALIAVVDHSGVKRAWVLYDDASGSIERVVWMPGDKRTFDSTAGAHSRPTPHQRVKWIEEASPDRAFLSSRSWNGVEALLGIDKEAALRRNAEILGADRAAQKALEDKQSAELAEVRELISLFPPSPVAKVSLSERGEDGEPKRAEYGCKGAEQIGHFILHKTWGMRAGKMTLGAGKTWQLTHVPTGYKVGGSGAKSDGLIATAALLSVLPETASDDPETAGKAIAPYMKTSGGNPASDPKTFERLARDALEVHRKARASSQERVKAAEARAEETKAKIEAEEKTAKAEASAKKIADAVRVFRAAKTADDEAAARKKETAEALDGARELLISLAKKHGPIDVDGVKVAEEDEPEREVEARPAHKTGGGKRWVVRHA